MSKKKHTEKSETAAVPTKKELVKQPVPPTRPGSSPVRHPDSQEKE